MRWYAFLLRFSVVVIQQKSHTGGVWLLCVLQEIINVAGLLPKARHGDYSRAVLIVGQVFAFWLAFLHCSFASLLLWAWSRRCGLCRIAWLIAWRVLPEVGSYGYVL